MELNAEQIKFALVCHADWNSMCEQCPYTRSKACGSQLARDALALIKELTAENESLQKAIVELSTENVALIKEKTALECVVSTARNQAKADTVRKMQEALTSFFAGDEMLEHVEVDAEYINEQIDRVAKELVEGTGNDVDTSVD